MTPLAELGSSDFPPFGETPLEQNGGDDDQTEQTLMINGIFRRTPEGS